MNRKRWLAGLVLCGLLCAMILLFVDQAQAAGASTSGLDKGLGQKRGIQDSLAQGDKKEDDDNSPSKGQVFLGIGSIFVMIAVVKWL